jgi:ubiquinone/menaquinone biosynthesis C-methylase UbiE
MERAFADFGLNSFWKPDYDRHMAKAYKGMGMEGAVARWYAAITRKSLADFELLAERVAGELPLGSSVLEVAPGPGYFAIALAKLGDYRVTGLDISQTFVEIARANALSAKVQAQFERGDASRMPFDGERFDYVVCRAAFKNFAEPVAALQEMHRVLKPGGRALIIDMRGNASPESMKEAAKGLKNGAVNSWIVYLSFRFMLVRRAYTRAEFERMIGRTAFRQLEIRESLIGLEILLAKT